MPQDIINNDLTTEQIKTLIDTIAMLGVNAITYTGGEPTLRKDLPEILRYTGVVHDFVNGIATNGFLMHTLMKNHKLEGLDYILTSIDYPTAEQHDKMRGIKVFDKVLQMIDIANKRNIKVIISTVVMKDNIHLLEKICELGEKLNCSMELFPCEDIIRDFRDKRCQITNVRSMIPDISLWAKTVRELRTKFKNILTDPFSIDMVEKGGFGRNSSGNVYQDVLRCHTAGSFLFISHDGFVMLPCKIHPIRSINAFKIPLSKMYYTNEVREIMKKLDTYEFCNGCRLGCAIAASLPTSGKALYAKYVKGFIDGNLR